ncbi:monocarboxylate transporter 13-like [Dermacentor silvarum]|uniref:monocarboxylate transporter 13-like n=1 Tax=Dermacentor silvarum TaxID=543639 RepID=UPI0021013EBB|nr:monocarboxylate transporter 13-like [Dermacentor silvarum]
METNTARNLYYIQDQCWSIPVVAACAAFLISAVDSSRGYLYVLYMDKYGIDRATAAWPDSILAVTRNLSGFAVTLLQSRLSVFSMTLLSVAVCSGGMIAGAFAPNIVWTAVAVGGFYGFGFGASLACFSVYALLYFTKYRATASSTKFAAWSISGLVCPSFISFLANNYGLHGALLLSGACILQAAPLIMLLKRPRPLKCCYKAPNDETEPTGTPNTKILLNKIGTHAPPRSSPCPPEAPVNRLSDVACMGMTFKSAARLFRTANFYVLTAMYVMFDWSDSVLITTAADYGKDKGATLEKAKFVLTAIAIGNLVGRTVVPCAADRISFSHAPFGVAALAASFLFFLVTSMVKSFEYFAVFSAVLGVFHGYVSCIKPVLFAEYLGVQYVPIMFGITGLFLVPVSLSGPTILGAFRDTLGSYDNLYRVLGALNLFGAMLLFLLVFRDRARRRTWEVNKVTATTSNHAAGH